MNYDKNAYDLVEKRLENYGESIILIVLKNFWQK